MQCFPSFMARMLIQCNVCRACGPMGTALRRVSEPRCCGAARALQSACIMLLTWMPCIVMLFCMLQGVKVSCNTFDQRNQLGLKAFGVSCFPSSARAAMDSWFAAPAAAMHERQVRPRVRGSSKEQDQLLKAVAKLTLRNARACPNMESIVFITYILPKAE